MVGWLAQWTARLVSFELCCCLAERGARLDQFVAISLTPLTQKETSEDAPDSSASQTPARAEMATLGAIEHAINLLQHAVDTDCPAHFQPSTACIISAIRGLLSATNCLTRESDLLRRYPALARERKQILSGLASLVTQARKSSYPAIAAEDRQSEIESMLNMATQVLANVRRFLLVAAQCGVYAQEEPSSTSSRSLPSQRMLSKARSTGNLRADVSPRWQTPHSPGAPSVTTASSRSPIWTLGRSASSSTSSFEVHPLDPAETSAEAQQAVVSMVKQLEATHDQLLSIVAAFIGHVHAHSRAAHASSFAHLIDVTVEITEKVRQILALIEGLPSRSSSLEAARTLMYTATSALVTAARTATTVTSSSVNGLDQEDEEKQGLLSSATAVLRASNTCLGALRDVDASQHLSDRPSESDAPPTSARARHTLSMLGRKATTLTFLRDNMTREAALESKHSSENPVLRSALAQLQHGVSHETSSLSSRRGVPGPAPLLHLRTGSTATSVSGTSTVLASDTEHEGAIDMARNGSSRTHESIAKTSSTASLDADSDGNAPSSASSVASEGADSAKAANSPLSTLPNRDYGPSEISFNTQGAVIGGTLRSLVERLTLHDTMVDATFASAFFMTFRLFTDPLSLCRALFARYETSLPVFVKAEDERLWLERRVLPIRLRVYNALRTWLEAYWRPETDHVILGPLRAFAQEKLMPTMAPAATQRLADLLERRAIERQIADQQSGKQMLHRVASTERLRPSRSIVDPNTAHGGIAPPAPLISRGLLVALRSLTAAPNVAITDIDATELARQLTLLCSKVYCAIKPEELLGQEFSKKSSAIANNVRSMSTLSTRLTGWVTETILQEPDTKRRSQLLKQFIKIADRCALLRNFDTVMAILAALNSSTISRLRKTWDGLNAKYRAIVEALRTMTDSARNFAEYRSTLRAAVPPALPFLGLFLTDLTFIEQGNSATRPSPIDPSLSLINFLRYQRIAGIIGEIQRFQMPYAFIEIPELQAWLAHCLSGVVADGDVERLYRQSLLLEPRAPESGNGSPIFAIPNKFFQSPS